MDKDQTTTPGTTRPTLYDKCVGSLTSPANQNNEDAGDGAYGLSSLSENYRPFWNDRDFIATIGSNCFVAGRLKLVQFCSWMTQSFHDLRKESSHSLTHFILINLFIKVELNICLLPPLLSMFFSFQRRLGLYLAGFMGVLEKGVNFCPTT